MNLYTLFYTRSFQSGSHRHTLPGFCRVWAKDEVDAVETCNEELGEVFAIVAGHPEILSHTAEQIPTYDWGNPK
jgi:hypothetical protein